MLYELPKITLYALNRHSQKSDLFSGMTQLAIQALVANTR